MPNTIDDARQLISSRLAELEAEATRLERALASLGEGSSSRPRHPARPNASSSDTTPSARKRHSARKRKSTRARRGQRRKQLLAAMKVSPGARPADFAKAIGIKPAQAHALIRKAKAEKLIVRQGKGYMLKG